MKNLIALFSEKRSAASLATFSKEILSVNELIHLRGGGEHALREETPIIIPPGGDKTS